MKLSPVEVIRYCKQSRLISLSLSLRPQSYIVDIRELDEPIVNVIDYHFLYGYYEPTLFILYEPLRTWGGRVAVRQDTCAIAAISLNITQKVM